MGATGLHLGSISPGRGARPGTPWWARRAILDADFRQNRFRFGGKTFTDQADFLAMAGGVEAGGSLIFGPYVVPEAPELIVNGDFAEADLAGWTPVLNGSSVASGVSGAAQLTSDGSSGLGGGGAGITQPLATTEHRAYHATYTVSTATCNFRIGGTASETAPGPAGGTRSPGSYVDTFSARAGLSHFYAFRGPAGSTRVSNVSVRPCLPLKGMGDGGLTVEIEAEAPASTAARQVLWSCGHLMTADPGDEIQIVCQPGGELHVEVRAASHLQVSLNLGEIEPGAPFVVRAGFANDAYFAQLDDGIAISDDSGVLVGLAAMRLGNNLAGDSWGGAIHRFTVYGEGGAETFYGLVHNLIRCEGDAVFAGGLASAAIATATGRTTVSTAEDGASVTDIGERIRASANAHLRARTAVIWQAVAEAESVPDVAGWCDALAKAVAELGHRRFVLVPALVTAGETDFGIADAIRDALAAHWPQNLLDWRDHLELDANGAPLEAMFEDPGSGSLRLSETATDLIATAIASFIDTKGW